MAADDYRRRSAECLALAQRISDSEDKAKMLEIAEAWRRLADWSEARESKEQGS